MSKRTWQTLNVLTGGLSDPSKMPGKAYGLPALLACPVGALLARKPGSTCSGCYALKGRYAFDSVRAAQARRLDATRDPRWRGAMVASIEKTQTEFFRIHDSGDFYSFRYFLQWVKIARALPRVRFWAPTRQWNHVRRYTRRAALPSNLTVRVSAAMVDSAPPGIPAPTSTVHKNGTPYGHECPAPKQGGRCGDCRACWNPKVRNVSYRAH